MRQLRLVPWEGTRRGLPLDGALRLLAPQQENDTSADALSALDALLAAAAAVSDPASDTAMAV